MTGTKLAKPGYPLAYFPDAQWDGLTENHTSTHVIDTPDDSDYKRLACELLAMQDHLRALFTRTGEDDIKLVTPVWDDMRFPVSSLKIPSSNNPTWTAYKSAQVLAFSDQAVEGNEEKIYFSAQLPHNYKMGTDLEAHVHWVGEDATVGNVRWSLTYNIAEIGSAFGANINITADVANAALNVHNYSDIDSIDMSTYTDIGDVSIMIIGELRRNSSHANDTFTSLDAYLLELDFHYQIDKFGSSDEATHVE